MWAQFWQIGYNGENFAFLDLLKFSVPSGELVKVVGLLIVDKF